MDDDYEKFVKNMNTVYSKFGDRLAELRCMGTQPEGMIQRKEGCYAIAFQPEPLFSQKLGAYSAAIGEVIPAMIYDSHKIQITVTPFQLVDNFSGNPQDPAIDVLKRAVEYALENVSPSIMEARQVIYDGWFYSRGVVMAPGWPNREQFLTVQALLKGCRLAGFEPKGPWGSHCMINRFLKEVPAERCQGLFRLIDEPPELKTTVSLPSLAVLDNTILPDGQFECTIHQEWSLS